MGLNFLFSGGRDYGFRDDIAPNPNKYQFQILSEERINSGLIVLVLCKGCTTYEGKKILVYLGVASLQGETELDPHFLEQGLTPIARFPATEEGMALARSFALHCL